MYVNDMKIAVETCDLLLYADDACLVYTDQNITNVETNLNTDFNSLCDWFIDNKLSIHLGEDKTKSILFGKAKKVRQMRDMNIARGGINIKQYLSVNYLGCILDHDLSGKSMFSHVSGKISGRLKFLYRKQTFLSFQLRRLLCNALIQPHFDYASSAWYPNLNKKYKKKIQILQNKCIRFCLSLGNRHHIGYQEFKNINWLPTKQRYEQSVCTKVHNFYYHDAPVYMNEIFEENYNFYNIGTLSKTSKCKGKGQKLEKIFIIPWPNVLELFRF